VPRENLSTEQVEHSPNSCRPAVLRLGGYSATSKCAGLLAEVVPSEVAIVYYDRAGHDRLAGEYIKERD